MASKGDKPESKKRRLASSHDTVVITISSDSDESYMTSLKKLRRGPQSGKKRPAFNLVSQVVPPSQMGENGLGISSHTSDSFVSEFFFCRPSDSPADRKEMLTSCSRTEWAPRKCLSTARFNGEHLWLRVPASDEELEDTASSYRAAENISPRSGDCPVKRYFTSGALPEHGHRQQPNDGNSTSQTVRWPAVNVQSEVGENSPVMSSHFSGRANGADRCCCCKRLPPPHQ